MKFFIMVLFLAQVGFANENRPSQCNFTSMEKELIEKMGMSREAAQVYSTSFQHFFANLDHLNIRLKDGVYKQDLVQLKSDLMNSLGISEVRANNVIRSIRTVRMISLEFGVSIQGPCLGN